MKIDVAAVRQCLKSFDFKTLFREHLGWDNHQAQLEISVNDQFIGLTAVAQKRGFVAFACPLIPDRATRLKIDHQVTKSAREHFVIYTDPSAGQQVWQWVRREPGKPLASRDHRFHINQSGQLLIEKLEQIAVSLDEEEKITVTDVAGRARAAFDVDKVTRKFYDRFKAEHAAFHKLIRGIKTEADLQWYTSLMLNRLMFVYFIQKKGFLDGDTNYLRNRLAMVRQVKGKDNFQSFYRYFLLRLFHDGLGMAPDERQLDPTMEKLLGKVPYLDGGFFEVHQLEEQNPGIDIPDQAFEKLFDFFDQYSWHLDERPLRADNEINPDVVGYIFEKYINQKQMGAYYTKEDITEYISKNTIIPFLFDVAEKQCAIAFKPDSALWRLLRDEPDRYLYPAVRHGVIRTEGSVVPESDLPDFVQKGMHDPNARMHDNRYNLQQAPAGDPIRLVTETWREYVARRQRCLDIREKLRRCEVHQINDLITLNLDIWQFARDAIVNAEGSELLRAFWLAIEKVTVLDPTCGSGAFLFAALRILETLYSDCLERMERFVEDLAASETRHPPEQYSDFKKVLAQIARHPSDRYFILKSIIINNLFGVDIMEEAVEICKLRLFLKLVAQVEAVGQVEPLPDIDFNIRAGNTLVGFASLEQVRKSQEGTLGFGKDQIKRIEEDAEMVERAFRLFRAQQTIHGARITREDKQELRNRLTKLDAELDRYLAGEYGVNVDKPEDFDAWKASHEPFHWFVEFYGIMAAGGFDVIIGNPPYVEYKKVTSGYRLLSYETHLCGNLYAYILERAISILARGRRLGMIIPLSGFSTERMTSLRELYLRSYDCLHYLWLSADAHPGILFPGVKFRLCIVSGRTRHGNSTSSVFTTNYYRWLESERAILFERLSYVSCLPRSIWNGAIPKIADHIHFSILQKLLQATRFDFTNFTNPHGLHCIIYHNVPAHWTRAHDFVPYFWSERDGQKTSTQLKELRFKDLADARRALAFLNSSLFFRWWITLSDCYHLNTSEVLNFPFPGNLLGSELSQLDGLMAALMTDYQRKSKRRVYTYQATGKVEYDEFYPKHSKCIIDEIDRVLAKHYGFTGEELDFIINYDIKYRMGGADADNGDDV